MNGENELSLLFQAINALGVVGILGFLVIAFYRGDLISKVVLDRILKVYETQLANMTERIMKRLDDALEHIHSGGADLK